MSGTCYGETEYSIRNGFYIRKRQAPVLNRFVTKTGATSFIIHFVAVLQVALLNVFMLAWLEARIVLLFVFPVIDSRFKFFYLILIDQRGLFPTFWKKALFLWLCWTLGIAY